MSGFGPRPGASGGEVIDAPRPSDGNGARPTSLPPALAGTGARAGSGAAGIGGGGAARTSGPDVERFPNTLVSAALSLLAPELLDERGQQVGARPFHLGTAGERLREMPESLRRTMPGRDFGDHLSIVGCRAEQLRLEGNRCRRIELQRLGEIRRLDFRALRHADLVEAVLRAVVVRPRGAQ